MNNADLVEKLLQQADSLRQREEFGELIELLELAAREIEILQDYKEMYIEMWKD